MIKLKEAVIVEGRYDKIKLDGILDCLIVTTDGFGIFKDKEKQKFLRRLADEKGLIILTDSDSAGFIIRNFVASCVGLEKVKNVYIPDIYGKEKRKREPSAEGKLGVEGVSEQVILDALQRSGINADKTTAKGRQITNIDLFECGLSGRENSRANRQKFLASLDLPQRMSTNNLLRALNDFLTYDDFIKTAKELGLCE